MMTLHCDDDDWDLFDFFASGMPFLFLIFEIQFITVVIFRASRREWPFLFFGAGANLRMRFCASSTRAFRLRTDGSFEKVAWRILPCSSFFTSSIMNLQTDFALLKNRLAFISLTCLGWTPYLHLDQSMYSLSKLQALSQDRWMGHTCLP